jgi:hypothetical protein
MCEKQLPLQIPIGDATMSILQLSVLYIQYSIFIVRWENPFNSTVFIFVLSFTKLQQVHLTPSI